MSLRVLLPAALVALTFAASARADDPPAPPPEPAPAASRWTGAPLFLVLGGLGVSGAAAQITAGAVLLNQHTAVPEIGVLCTRQHPNCGTTFFHLDDGAHEAGAVLIGTGIATGVAGAVLVGIGAVKLTKSSATDAWYQPDVRVGAGRAELRWSF